MLAGHAGVARKKIAQCVRRMGELVGFGAAVARVLRIPLQLSLIHIYSGSIGIVFEHRQPPVAQAAITGHRGLAAAQPFKGAFIKTEKIIPGAERVFPGRRGAAAEKEHIIGAVGTVKPLHRSAGQRVGRIGYYRIGQPHICLLYTSAVFFRSHTVVTLGATQSGEAYQADAYPSRAGAAVDGCRTPFSTGIAGNEPCFLAKTGIYSVRSVSNELTNLNETVERSAPVQPLLEELDAADARSVCWRRYYLLCFGKIALITDGKRDSAGSYRFLKWRFSHAMSALAQSRGQLYLGSTEGKLYLLEETGTDASLPFEAFWQTPLLEEKSSRRLLLRKIYAAATPGFGAVLQARLEQEGGTLGTVSIALGRPDFACWDFGAVSFEMCIRDSGWSGHHCL